MAIVVSNGVTISSDGTTPDPDATVTTRNVALQNPTTFVAATANEIIPDVSAANTQEDANNWFVESLDALDEALSPLDGGNY